MGCCLDFLDQPDFPSHLKMQLKQLETKEARENKQRELEMNTCKVVDKFIYFVFWYIYFMIQTDRRSPATFVVRCSVQTSPYILNRVAAHIVLGTKFIYISIIILLCHLGMVISHMH